MNYLDYVIYEPLPKYFIEAYSHNHNLGWRSTRLTPDKYTIKPAHCPFKHIKEITIPKINKIKNHIDGFFIIEGDVKIDISYKEFLNLNIEEPTWLGYKKILSNYIVGNFLIYIPIKFFDEFKDLIDKQERNIFSDRFFTKLYFDGWLKLYHKTIAREIPHYSNVLGGFRV